MEQKTHQKPKDFGWQRLMAAIIWYALIILSIFPAEELRPEIDGTLFHIVSLLAVLMLITNLKSGLNILGSIVVLLLAKYVTLEPETFYIISGCLIMLFVMGIVITKPGFSYVPVSWSQGLMKDTKTLPLITYVAWPYENVSKKYSGFIGVRTINFEIKIQSAMGRKLIGKDVDGKKTYRDVGTIEITMTGNMKIRTVNLFKVLMYEGGIKVIDENIKEEIESPARDIGRSTIWEKLIFDVTKTKAKQNIGDAILAEIRSLPGYEKGDMVLGVYGQEVIAVNILDIKIPKSVSEASEKIEIEELERISDVKDLETEVIQVNKLKAIGVDPDVAYNGTQAKKGFMERKENQYTLKIAGGEGVAQTITEAVTRLSPAINAIAMRINAPGKQSGNSGKSHNKKGKQKHSNKDSTSSS